MSGIQLMAANGTADGAVAAAGAVNAKKPAADVKVVFSSYMQQTSYTGAQVSGGRQDSAQDSAKGTTVQQDYEQCQSRAAAQADKVSAAGESDSDTVSEAVDGAVDEIKEIIESELGVDEEQVEAAMELLGLTGMDLLDTQNLIALTMELTGTKEPGLMLFQQNFQNVLSQAGVVTQDLLDELGMSMDELVQKLGMPQEVAAQPEAGTMVKPAEFARTFEAAAQAAPQEVQTDVPAEQQVQRQTEQTAPQEAVQTVTETGTGTEEVRTQTVQTQEQTQPAPQEETAPEEKAQVQKTADVPQQENTGDQGDTTEDGTPGRSFEQGAQPEHNTALHVNADAHTPADIQTVRPQQASVPLPQVDVQSVIDQIAEYSKTMVTESVKSIEMQLNPEHLGKLYLHVSEKEGAVTAQITVQNEEVRDALLQQTAVLRDNLNQAGVKVQAVEVSVGTHEFENNLEGDARQQEEQARQQEEHNRRTRRSIDLSDLDGLTGLMSEEEALVARIMRDNGNNVDYRA